MNVDEIDESKIDRGVLGLVLAMNRDVLGIRTIASCEGHLMNRYAPYVYFTCPVSVAMKINRRLMQLRGEVGILNYPWTLEGTFNPEEQLCFSLRSPVLEHIQGGIFPPFITFWQSRYKIDDDLAVLADDLTALFDDLEAHAES